MSLPHLGSASSLALTADQQATIRRSSKLQRTPELPTLEPKMRLPYLICASSFQQMRSYPSHSSDIVKRAIVSSSLHRCYCSITLIRLLGIMVCLPLTFQQRTVLGCSAWTSATLPTPPASDRRPQSGRVSSLRTFKRLSPSLYRTTQYRRPHSPTTVLGRWTPSHPVWSCMTEASMWSRRQLKTFHFNVVIL